ncbi:MAG: hypothetical protein RL434_2620 [Pseudomonadota bacterium]
MNPSKLWASSLETVSKLYDRTIKGLSSGLRCRLCLASSGEALCPGCRADLPWLPSTQRALQRSYGLELAAFSYEFPISSLIVSAKYHAARGTCRLLGDLLAASLAPPTEPVDCLVPVPMPWQRVLKRGYNQAEEVASVLAGAWNIPLRVDVLKRRGWQPPQRGASRRARKANLKTAFVGEAELAGRAVLLVDDVTTTGATLEACAEALQRAGASRVSAVVVARTA